jgi:DNA invertase Pin-like site-specific DNA recombinase
MKGAFGYIRVSSPGQALDDRDGFPRQKEAIRKWAAANYVRISRWFQDVLPGATPLQKRPGMEALMGALLGDGIRTVIIEKLDRLARDTMISETAVAYFQRNEFELISAQEPDLCASTDPTRVLFRTMLAAFSQYEKSMIILKLKVARLRAKAKDPTRHEGRKPYGFHAAERDTLSHIRLLHSQGMTFSAIANTLNAEGRSTRTGAVWYPKTISNILKRAKPL